MRIKKSKALTDASVGAFSIGSFGRVRVPIFLRWPFLITDKLSRDTDLLA